MPTWLGLSISQHLPNYTIWMCPSYSSWLQEMESTTKNKVGRKPQKTTRCQSGARGFLHLRKGHAPKVIMISWVAKSMSNYDGCTMWGCKVCEAIPLGTRNLGLGSLDTYRESIFPYIYIFPYISSFCGPRFISMAFLASKWRICGGICRRVLSTTRFTWPGLRPCWALNLITLQPVLLVPQTGIFVMHCCVKAGPRGSRQETSMVG